MAHSPPTAFFVYGTLMRGQANFGACAGDALTVTPATAVATLYHVDAGFPIAVDAGRGRVVGQILTFPDPPHTLRVFDELEGVDPREPGEALYVRVAREARPLDGRRAMSCWMYLVPPARLAAVRPYATCVPDGDWAAYLAAQARV